MALPLGFLRLPFSILYLAFSFVFFVVVNSQSVQSTVLVIAQDSGKTSVTEGLNGYGIPFYVLTVPQAGVALPVLSTGATGNYGAIVVISQVSYDYGGGNYSSAITPAQWTTLYNYQTQFGVRMVHLNVYPGPLFGATALGGCCGTGVEQLVSISNAAAFPTAGLNLGATMSTQGLYHYPASITDSNTTEFAQFAANSQFASVSTAAVINNYGGRQQMAFFLGFSLDWSATSSFLQHAWIHWATRGIYSGYRRINLNTQIDDMFLETEIYSPGGTNFRVRPADLTAHVSWVASVNAKMNVGSLWFPEVGHNGNGNIEASSNIGTSGFCGNGGIEYNSPPDTPLEFQKPLGTGTNLWPTSPTTYTWNMNCLTLDPLEQWWANTANRDTFAHVTHTFTHEEENNATYSDITKEISFNVNWLKAVGIYNAKWFSPSGLIPPAITGLHNGDAIRAWHDNGLWNAVGDNTRPVLMNQQNNQWPLITTVAANGYAGYQITPRWATNIYYNCDLPDCTVAEWKATSAGVGDFTTLLGVEKAANSRHLLGLHHDPYMFHQANLRQTDVPTWTINGVTKQYSLFMIWVEVIAQEMVRLVNWPMISQKHDDIATSFASRMARDACAANIAYAVNNVTRSITGVTVSTKGNTCSQPVPITVPGSVTNTQGFRQEKIGNDPLTLWVTMSGSPVTFTLSSPVKL